MRAQCSVFIAMSLDGFIARPDGRIDWLKTVERPGEDYGYKAFFDSIDALVTGRKTYETALGFDAWPYGGKRCIVLTHDKSARPRHAEEFSSEIPKKLIARLTADGAKRIYVDGGAVIQSFLAAGLVTDLTVSVVPVLLGEGIPLFGNTGPDIPLELVSSRAFESGLVQVEYRVRKPARPREERKARPRSKGKGQRAKVERESRPKDVIGFLLALPMDPGSEEVARLAHEFGITGPVEVRSYSAPDDHIHLDFIEGDPTYSVTRYPMDMQGYIGRLADKLIEGVGGPDLGSGSSPTAAKATASRAPRHPR